MRHYIPNFNKTKTRPPQPRPTLRVNRPLKPTPMYLKFFLPASLLLILLTAFQSQIEDAYAENEFLVVELFTSQGCHSCPPADRLLSNLVSEAETEGKTIFPLSFHVDYWNYLGWKDPYSQSAFSERQRRYAKQLGSNVYTPQMVFNGASEAVGSRPKKVKKQLKKAVKKLGKSDIRVNAELSNDKINITYSVTHPPKNAVLQIALVERNIVDQIARGENRGKKLHHDNVVRAFKTQKASLKEKETSINIPEGVDLAQSSIITFLQDEETLEILGARQLQLNP